MVLKLNIHNSYCVQVTQPSNWRFAFSNFGTKILEETRESTIFGGILAFDRSSISLAILSKFAKLILFLRCGRGTDTLDSMTPQLLGTTRLSENLQEGWYKARHRLQV